MLGQGFNSPHLHEDKARKCNLTGFLFISDQQVEQNDVYH